MQARMFPCDGFAHRQFLRIPSQDRTHDFAWA